MDEQNVDRAFRPAHRADASGVIIYDAEGEIRKLEEIERDVIALALMMSKGCITRAAAQLGIGRSTLYRKLPELKISRPS